MELKAINILKSYKINKELLLESGTLSPYSYVIENKNLIHINESIEELEDLEIKENCNTCKNKLLCKKADSVKLMWGFRLSEMWFNCWESKC